MVLVYFLAPGRMKNTVLLFGSLIFYGWGEPKYLPVMAAVILAGYLSARLIGTCQNKRQSKILLAAAVLLEIFPLIYCKYADFFIQNLNVLTGQKIPLLSIAMPLGISFYTFQVISYTVDVYRGDVPAQKNLLTFAAYVAMFPQLVAGPIVRYSDIRSQLENRTHSVEKCAYGIRRFVTGLSKKILIANVLGELIGQFQASEEKSVLFFWMYAVAFMLQIYFDFSGYSDMAIGLGMMLGFHFPENFDCLPVHFSCFTAKMDLTGYAFLSQVQNQCRIGKDEAVESDFHTLFHNVCNLFILFRNIIEGIHRDMHRLSILPDHY